MTRALNPNALAVNADYADAMLTARRAKNVLFLLILLMLLVQIAVFFVWRYPLNKHHADSSFSATTTLASQDVSKGERLGIDAVRYLTGLIDFLGIALTIVLAVVLLLIILVMMVARLIGAAHLTSSFIWCIVLAVLLFPWQAFLISNDRIPETMRAPTTSESIAATLASEQQMAAQPAFKIPGVLYTWVELQQDGRFDNTPLPNAILKWSRFVGFPILALLILLSVQSKSSRGLRFALGESDAQVELTTPSV